MVFNNGNIKPGVHLMRWSTGGSAIVNVLQDRSFIPANWTAGVPMREWNDVISCDPLPASKILYKNWQGRTTWRRVIPFQVLYMAFPPYYPVACWLLHAWDTKKTSFRYFKLDSFVWGEPDPDAPPLDDNQAAVLREMGEMS